MRVRLGFIFKVLFRYVLGAVVGTLKGDGGGFERRVFFAFASVSGRKGDRSVRGVVGVFL